MEILINLNLHFERGVLYMDQQTDSIAKVGADYGADKIKVLRRT
jgi:hypothetical protein